MKDIDVSKSVMKKVVDLEKRRVKFWLVRAGVLLLGLAGVGSVAFILAGREIMDLQTLGILQVFTDDWNSVSDYWQDALTAFWDELPQDRLGVTLVSVIGVVVIFVVIARNRKALLAKWRSIQAYSGRK